MKFQSPNAQCAKGVFQIQFLICGVYFSNISIPQIRVNKKETEPDSASSPLNSRINFSIILKTDQDLFSRMPPTMAGEKLQTYTVQITGKCVCENFPRSLHDLIIRPYVKHPPPSINLPKKVCSHIKGFFKRKTSSQAKTLCFIFK